jgi:hypothetical protein
VRGREGRLFSPTGVLRLNLNDDEQEQVLETVRDVLLELRS